MSIKLQALQKQNDSILLSILSRKIDFVRSIIPESASEEEHIKILTEENLRLKEVVKANKPVPQPKEEKPKIEQQPKQESKPKEELKEDDDQEETFEEPVKKFETITNMEDLKRAFFNGLYEEFESHVKASPYKFYRVEYKYNGDKLYVYGQAAGVCSDQNGIQYSPVSVFSMVKDQSGQVNFSQLPNECIPNVQNIIDLYRNEKKAEKTNLFLYRSDPNQVNSIFSIFKNLLDNNIIVL
jgi:hypothetical protein